MRSKVAHTSAHQLTVGGLGSGLALSLNNDARGGQMRKLLHWLTQDDVARTNAAQASVRLKHRRRDREAADAFLAEHARSQEPQAWRLASRITRHSSTGAARRP